ncbi:MAG: dihydrodipicolinate reductase, partial [Armatimonadetes bacterium]|nr:dihydrodipicolinate reductase [Armatimonadota bacterium]
MSLRIAHIGLGPIGCAVITQIAARGAMQSVCAIDLDPQKIGRNLGEIASSDAPNLQNVLVRSDMDAALREIRPDVAVLCTSSSLPRVWPQIETIARAGVPIVSTTEELAFPSGPNAHFTAKLDALAKECGVGIVGTGVNPGFVMDTLPILLSGACERVEKIRVERVQDAS